MKYPIIIFILVIIISIILWREILKPRKQTTLLKNAPQMNSEWWGLSWRPWWTERANPEFVTYQA